MKKTNEQGGGTKRKRKRDKTVAMKKARQLCKIQNKKKERNERNTRKISNND